MNLRFVQAAFVVATLALPGQASFLTFESVPGVTPQSTFIGGSYVDPSSRLSNQLQFSDGVSFSSTPGYIALVQLGFGHATSGVNGIDQVDSSDSLDPAQPLIIDFFIPGTAGVPGVVDFVSLRGDQSGGGGIATMTAYDLNYQLLGSVSAPDTFGGLTLSISFPGIHNVVITQSAPATIAFDDLNFPTPTAGAVPAPATILAFGLGLAALRLRRVRS